MSTIIEIYTLQQTFHDYLTQLIPLAATSRSLQAPTVCCQLFCMCLSLELASVGIVIRRLGLNEYIEYNEDVPSLLIPVHPLAAISRSLQA